MHNYVHTVDQSTLPHGLHSGSTQVVPWQGQYMGHDMTVPVYRSGQCQVKVM